VNVHDVNQNSSATVFSGCQEGNAFEVRNFGDSPSTIHVTFDTVTATRYQKTAIVCNGDSTCTITDSKVVGNGPQGYLAQNGVQFGFGSSGNSIKRSEVSGNAYTGTSDVSGGIIVVAGPYYGSAFSIGDQIMNNTLKGTISAFG
jgi:hypothetical protein